MTDLKTIKTRLDKASPGPWRALAGAKQRAHMAAGHSNAVVPLVLANRDLIVNAWSDIEYIYAELRLVRRHLRHVLSNEPDAAVAATAYLNDTEKST